MKLKKVEYYGFDHKKVAETFEGQLSFVNEMCVNDEYKPVAVYRAAKPNRKKGHKDYMLLQIQTDIATGEKSGLIRGMNADEMEKWRFQEAVHCFECDTVLYSVNRHHFHKCGCPNEAMIDGGRDYTRSGAKDLTKVRIVTLDLLTDTIKES